jgi:signal transduction histidine kinase
MAAAERSRVLIVEDDPGIAWLERRALERSGYDAATAATPEEAAAQLAASPCDLAILDYRLATPVTGLDLYRCLQKDWPDLPAILVTGFSDEGKVIEALRAGIRDVVPKVGDYLEYLPQAVERVLKGVRAEQKLAASEAMLREANEELERRVAERTAELQRTKELAESANQAKDHFLAVLSHELRTPLTPVLTTVQLLERRAGLPDDLRESLSMIRRNVELEARLIDDLLDLTRISRGKLELDFEIVDLNEALREVLAICHRDLQAKQIAVTADLPAAQAFVRADPARLQQVFWNVVKNAVKFTPVGGRIFVSSREGPEGAVQVRVTDSGVGIEPDVLPRIFDAFEQGGRDVTRLFGGLGLGLAISKALVDLHGGSITAESAGRGCGATFTITLAAAQEWAPRDSSPSLRPHAADRAGLRILLVEDHTDTREALSELLQIYGHDVETAVSVASALAAFAESPFDLLISDIGLPDGSGLDLMRQILARSPNGVKGICLTGYGMEDDLRRSREAGFLAHLTKPVNLQELESVLDRVMQETAPPLSLP